MYRYIYNANCEKPHILQEWSKSQRGNIQDRFNSFSLHFFKQDFQLGWTVLPHLCTFQVTPFYNLYFWETFMSYLHPAIMFSAILLDKWSLIFYFFLVQASLKFILFKNEVVKRFCLGKQHGQTECAPSKWFCSQAKPSTPAREHLFAFIIGNLFKT